MMKGTFLIHHFCLFGVHLVLSNICGPSEYWTNGGECCPMCPIGLVVLRDCTGDFSGMCIPCSKGTFMNEPNGLRTCFQCKTCSSDQGLYVAQPCTEMTDTVCDVLDGYHCTEHTGSDCLFAVQHKQCHPGERIKEAGTKTLDTVCEACPSGFYSPLGINCFKWTDCSVKNGIQIKEGSSLEDVQCTSKSRGRDGLIATTVLFSLFLFVIFLNAICNHCECCWQRKNGS